ncbi:hypothetical protein J5069_22855 [Candidatus Symbiopectobacterium sp. NZEC127]|uniref:hypothetical protein n=1 Tax=Candidatus Symbiopectobacterium sp. NZEC127 TaxID=2820472 RepID=UPI0022262CC7|nr:hypothetical protein [Candidatus Symbiopectobacterium sp. NZEC127]MCW2488745.1 hypothetical protein [Candidatus Symbiopectobacterium sp. NZEC127]
MIKISLLTAGLLMLACNTACAASTSGQINVGLSVVPTCEVKETATSARVECPAAKALMPKITQTSLSAGARTVTHQEQRLITIEW